MSSSNKTIELMSFVGLENLKEISSASLRLTQNLNKPDVVMKNFIDFIMAQSCNIIFIFNKIYRVVQRK